MFAESNVAFADAAIVVWDAKYNSKVIQPRPEDVITDGFAEKKGISGTVTDPNGFYIIPNPGQKPPLLLKRGERGGEAGRFHSPLMG